MNLQFIVTCYVIHVHVHLSDKDVHTIISCANCLYGDISEEELLLRFNSLSSSSESIISIPFFVKSKKTSG